MAVLRADCCVGRLTLLSSAQHTIAAARQGAVVFAAVVIDAIAVITLLAGVVDKAVAAVRAVEPAADGLVQRRTARVNASGLNVAAIESLIVACANVAVSILRIRARLFNFIPPTGPTCASGTTALSCKCCRITLSNAAVVSANCKVHHHTFAGVAVDAAVVRAARLLWLRGIAHRCRSWSRSRCWHRARSRRRYTVRSKGLTASMHAERAGALDASVLEVAGNLDGTIAGTFAGACRPCWRTLAGTGAIAIVNALTLVGIHSIGTCGTAARQDICASSTALVEWCETC